MKSDKESRPTRRVVEVVDVIVKLSASIAVLMAAWIANEYQSSMTSVSLLSKREEAESSLRAGMFHDLIGPITGPNKSDQVMPVAREQLMVELLALNFHEHFELKPLMLRVDQRLATETHYEGPDGKKVSAEQRQEARASLRSIARRVVQRQIALLTKEDSELDPDEKSCVYQLKLNNKENQNSSGKAQRCLQSIEAKFGGLITINSPNQTYKMIVNVGEPSKDNWENEEFNVYVKLRHICAYTANLIGVDDLNNAHAEITMLEALRAAKVDEFKNDKFYFNSMKTASEFRWNSESEQYDIDVLQHQAELRWARIKKLNAKISKLQNEGQLFLNEDFPDIKKLVSPKNMAKLPSDISCSTTDNENELLNSNYSLEVKSYFSLTPFDFPFTDNTLLADGTRFSIVVDHIDDPDEYKDADGNIDADARSASFKIIWFPKDYIAARERPINYADIRSKLGISFSK